MMDRQSAVWVLKEKADRLEREAEFLRALAFFIEDRIEPGSKADEALWLLATRRS